MDTCPTDQTLTDELDLWQVKLTTGDVLEIAAHGVAERGGIHVFVALVKVLGGGAVAGRLPYRDRRSEVEAAARSGPSRPG